MICGVYKPSRRKAGRRVRGRLWFGQYRLDGDVAVTRVPLKTADKQVARKRLDDIVRKLQQEREGLIAPAAMREAADSTLSELSALYTANLDSRGRSDHYINVTGVRIRRLAAECGWKYLADVSSASFQRWRASQKHAAKTLNDYLATMRGFIRWLIRQKMANYDPLKDVERVETRGRRKRQRRAFTVEEVASLLAAAPLERRRFYLAAYYTGLRRSELQSLEWGDLHLDDAKPFIEARASTTKNRAEVRIAIRPELLETLRSMRPTKARANSPVFGFVLDRTGHKLDSFRRDLKAAGIEYKDAQGRIADFHALSRVTPNTHLGQLGVGERIRQQFMRHSDLRLTSSVYTDAEQLPAAEAIQALPSFSEGCAQIRAQTLGATGHEMAEPCAWDWVI